MSSPNVLNTLHSNEAIPHCADVIPHCTEQSPQYWRYPLTVLKLPPHVLLLSPHSTEGSLHSTEAIHPLYWATSTALKLSPHITEAVPPTLLKLSPHSTDVIPLMYWTTSTVLNRRYLGCEYVMSLPYLNNKDRHDRCNWKQSSATLTISFHSIGFVDILNADPQRGMFTTTTKILQEKKSHVFLFFIHIFLIVSQKSGSSILLHSVPQLVCKSVKFSIGQLLISVVGTCFSSSEG